MKKETVKDKCSIKVPFIINKLDEFQKDWREGADVIQETKEQIQKHVEEKYGDTFSISIKTIENAITKARKRNDINNVRGKRDSPEQGSQESSENPDDEKQEDQYKIKLHKSLLRTFKKLMEEYPNEWKNYINDAIAELELEQKLGISLS